MKNFILAITAVSSIVLFGACTSDDDIAKLDQSLLANTRAEEAGIPQPPTTLDLLETYINKVKFANSNTNNGRKKAKGTTPSYTLTPYVYEGDSVMYLAQYDEGWDLLSTDEHTPIVLASSETGLFNKEELPEAIETYIASMAEEVAALKKTENTDLKRHDDWEMLYKTEEKANTRSGIEDYLGTGYWMLVSSTPVSSSVDSINHLTETRWHQGFPFNQFAPYYNGYHSNVGCCPVAVGQLLKYYFVKDGTQWLIPMPPADQSQFESLYNSSTNKYTFTNYGYGMKALETSGSLTYPRASYFLGYLGELMYANYANGLGSVTSINMLNALNNYMSYHFKMEDFNFTKALSILASGYPVLVSASTGANGSGGHAFLIDKYTKRTTKTAYVYAWVGNDIYGEPMNSYDEWGNVTSWVYSKTEYQTTGYSQVSMNWGLSNTSYNELKFSVFDTDWTVDTEHYKYNKKIYHNDY